MKVMKLRIKEVKNKKGKIRYCIQEQVLFWWIKFQNLKKFKNFKKAQKFIYNNNHDTF